MVPVALTPDRLAHLSSGQILSSLRAYRAVVDLYRQEGYPRETLQEVGKTIQKLQREARARGLTLELYYRQAADL